MSSADLDLIVTDQFGGVVATSARRGKESELVRIDAPAGRYFAVVSPYGQGPGGTPYRLKFTYVQRGKG